MFNLIVLQLALSEQERNFWPEEGEEIGDGRAEESSAIGDGEQAAMLVTPDVNGLSVHIFESLQLEDSYVGNLLYTVSMIEYNSMILWF